MNDIDDDHWTIDDDVIGVKLALNQNVCLSNAVAVYAVNTVHLMVDLNQSDHVDLAHVHHAFPAENKERRKKKCVNFILINKK